MVNGSARCALRAQIFFCAAAQYPLRPVVRAGSLAPFRRRPAPGPIGVPGAAARDRP